MRLVAVPSVRAMTGGGYRAAMTGLGQAMSGYRARAMTGYGPRDNQDEDEDTPLYTDEEYDELEGAFEY